MNSDFSDRDLEAMLSAKQDDTLPDDGFSQRVMQALPPRRHKFARKVGRYRVILCTAAGAAAWLLTLPSLQTAVASAETTQTELTQVAEAFAGLWSPEGIFILSALLFCAAVLFAANSQETLD